MGTFVERNTLRAMLLEILLKDKELFKDILTAIIKEDPTCLEELNTISASTLVQESHVAYQKTEKNNQNLKTEDITEAEARVVAKRMFDKYDAVFKALA